MRIYPFFGKDLALKEMVKIVNIADHFAVFVLFGKLPKCGYVLSDKPNYVLQIMFNKIQTIG